MKIKNCRDDIIKIITNLNNENKKIGCFSAPAKGNTLLNYLKIPNNIIKYVAENNSKKINNFTPGTRYKIITDKKFIKYKIEYALLLSWN